MKNNETDNDFNDRIETNDYTLLNNYNFDGFIYLFDKYDYVSNNDSFENYILERYWISKGITRYNLNLLNNLTKDYSIGINKINDKYSNLLSQYQNNISRDLKNYNIKIRFMEYILHMIQ